MIWPSFEGAIRTMILSDLTKIAGLLLIFSNPTILDLCYLNSGRFPEVSADPVLKSVLKVTFPTFQPLRF